METGPENGEMNKKGENRKMPSEMTLEESLWDVDERKMKRIFRVLL